MKPTNNILKLLSYAKDQTVSKALDEDRLITLQQFPIMRVTKRKGYAQWKDEQDKQKLHLDEINKLKSLSKSDISAINNVY